MPFLSCGGADLEVVLLLPSRKSVPFLAVPFVDLAHGIKENGVI